MDNTYKRLNNKDIRRAAPPAGLSSQKESKILEDSQLSTSSVEDYNNGNMINKSDNEGFSWNNHLLPG
jgi:hypothetical protein